MSTLRVNAVFEGGGMKAIGLVGAVKAAEEYGIQFHQLAGTSSGGIVSALISAGYTAGEMHDIIMESPFSSLVHTSWLNKIPAVGPALSLFLKKGLHSAEPLYEWIYKLLKAKGIETFDDLMPDKLRIIASDISRGKMLVLPDDLEYYGVNPRKFEVATAVLMSASIPYFFEPVILKTSLTKSYYIVDGGVLSNYPMWLFDRDMKNLNQKIIPAIGFHLVGKGQAKEYPIRGPITMFRALFATMMNAHDERYIEKNARFRTIKIPTLGVETTEFDLSPEMSERLYESGLRAGREFFQMWNLAQYSKLYEQLIINGKE